MVYVKSGIGTYGSLIPIFIAVLIATLLLVVFIATVEVTFGVVVVVSIIIFVLFEDVVFWFTLKLLAFFLLVDFFVFFIIGLTMSLLLVIFVEFGQLVECRFLGKSEFLLTFSWPAFDTFFVIVFLVIFFCVADGGPELSWKELRV